MSLVKTFRKALAEVKPRPVGGAVFCSGSTLDDKAWLSFFLRRNYTGPWTATSTITVGSRKLRNSPKFQQHWNRLREIVATGDLTHLSAPVGLPLPKKEAAGAAQLKLFEQG